MRILLVNDYGTPDGDVAVIVFGPRDQSRVRGHEVRVFTSAAPRRSEASHWTR